MSVQYQTTVDWDVSLFDLEYTDSSTAPAAMQGLVKYAIKKTTGAPTATAGKFIEAAIIANAVDSAAYLNTGTTASPVWTLIEASAGGLPALANGSLWIGNGSNVATAVAMSGVIAITNAGVTSIVDGSIVNADINASAAIAFSKLAALTSGNILVGSAGNVATEVSMSGDVAISNTGVTTVTDLTISGEAAGDILYFNGTNWVKLAIGTAGQVLTVNGGGTAPVWA